MTDFANYANLKSFMLTQTSAASATCAATWTIDVGPYLRVQEADFLRRYRRWLKPWIAEQWGKA